MCNLFTSNQEKGRGIQMKTHIYITPLALTPPGEKAAPWGFQAFPPHPNLGMAEQEQG